MAEPRWPSIDREAVNRAVQQAESQTSGEIVPVVAVSSGRYDRPEDIVGLWFALISLIAVWFAWPAAPREIGNWAEPDPLWRLAALLAAVVAGFVIGALLGARVHLLRRLFTSRKQMQDEVQSRARQVFFDGRVHHTRDRSGILLYVSRFERMAAILADDGILTRLGQSEIDTLCAEFSRRLQGSSLTAAVCETVDEVGRRLAAHLPRQADDVNELPDALLLIDGP